MIREILVYAIIVLSLVGIAAGRLPFLRMNRASMALAFAAMLIAVGAIGLEEALAAIDAGTIVLLLAMMLIVANLRLAGFFTAAGARILAAARTPRALLALVVASAGLLSALFLNDTICLMMTPLVAELALRARRDPVPYLVGLATGANIGSAATIIGNPQNMLIGASSGIPFADFAFHIGPVALMGLLLCFVAVALAFPAEFSRRSRLLGPGVLSAGGVPDGGFMPHESAAAVHVDRLLVAKSLGAALLMLLLLLAGVAPALASLVAAALLLFTRRLSPEKVFAEVDFSLLVFFAGLFIITRAIAATPFFPSVVDAARPALEAPGAAGLAWLSAFSVVASNLVSNVPTVMLARPLVPLFADSHAAWLVLAMASTFAGNLTLLGSVANLIVAEGAKRDGVKLGFLAYLKVGLPLTLATTALGTLWLLAFPHRFG